MPVLKQEKKKEFHPKPTPRLQRTRKKKSLLWAALFLSISAFAIFVASYSDADLNELDRLEQKREHKGLPTLKEQSRYCGLKARIYGVDSLRCIQSFGNRLKKRGKSSSKNAQKSNARDVEESQNKIDSLQQRLKTPPYLSKKEKKEVRNEIRHLRRSQAKSETHARREKR